MYLIFRSKSNGAFQWCMQYYKYTCSYVCRSVSFGFLIYRTMSMANVEKLKTEKMKAM